MTSAQKPCRRCVPTDRACVHAWMKVYTYKYDATVRAELQLLLEREWVFGEPRFSPFKLIRSHTKPALPVDDEGWRVGEWVSGAPNVSSKEQSIKRARNDKFCVDIYLFWLFVTFQVAANCDLSPILKQLIRVTTPKRTALRRLLNFWPLKGMQKIILTLLCESKSKDRLLD